MPDQLQGRPAVIAVLLVAALALGACGSDDEPSAEEQASAQVCDARDSIATEVDRLADMTITTVTVDDVTSSLRAIEGDLQTIADNESELSEDRRQEIEQATSRFADEVGSVLGDLGRSLSLSGAREQLSTALSQARRRVQIVAGADRLRLSAVLGTRSCRTTGGRADVAQAGRADAASSSVRLIGLTRRVSLL